MSKGKLVVFSLMAAALLCWQSLPTNVEQAISATADPCNSTASIATGGACLSACPACDGPALGSVGAVITVTVRDGSGAPIAGVPAGDVWLIGCSDLLAVYCTGTANSHADGPTNGAGQTAISGPLGVGGCDTGVKVVVQNTIIADPVNCAQDLCLPVNVRSADIDGDFDVDNADFGLFLLDLPSPPNPYNSCMDYSCGEDAPGILVGIVDFAIFGLHIWHVCGPC